MRSEGWRLPSKAIAQQLAHNTVMEPTAAREKRAGENNRTYIREKWQFQAQGNLAVSLGFNHAF